MRRVRGLPPLSRLLAIDLHSILSEYHLMKVDRASMQNSLEVRVPFLDVELIAVAFRLDAHLKLRGKKTKGLLREALRGRLPERILDRGKKGFGPPMRNRFGEEVRAIARDRLTGGEAVRAGWVQPSAVKSVLTSRRIDGTRLWRLLVLESWLRNLPRYRGV